MNNYIRTREEMQEALSEYKYELRNYSETCYNQVVVLDTNPSVTASKKKGELARIDTYIHPTKFNKLIAEKICVSLNKRLGGYSNCEIVTYKQWLTRRIKQLEDDLKKSVVK